MNNQVFIRNNQGNSTFKTVTNHYNFVPVSPSIWKRRSIVYEYILMYKTIMPVIMKNSQFLNLKRIVSILIFAFIFINSHAIYLGWNQKKLGRYLSRHAGSRIEVVHDVTSEVSYIFEEGNDIRGMRFYFDTEGKCFAYSIKYDLRSGDKLTEFIHDRFDYNASENIFQNSKYELHYEGGRTGHEIYVTYRKTDAGTNMSLR